MRKTLIVGLDLSFNSTGVTLSYLENLEGKRIGFYRVLFDDQTTKKGFNPKKFKNVINVVYRLPSNILVDDLMIDETNKNNSEQLEITLKGMIVQKKIEKIIKIWFDTYQPNEVIFNFENYVMPKFNGPTALKNVSGLIMLQGFIREIIIKTCLSYEISNIKILTETPTSNKLFFTGNGKAEKSDMLQAFVKFFDGLILIPEAIINNISHLNDVIDSFALMMQAYFKLIKQK